MNNENENPQNLQNQQSEITSQKQKKYTIPIAAAAAVLLLVILSYKFIFFRTSVKRLPDRYDGYIEKFISSQDMDGDGIDDQTDILQSTLDYLATKPSYKSEYYTTGYPDDGYGVCTDVVGAALRGAGYDLMSLVAYDVSVNQEYYDISVPDPNIDFRRVKNLQVFFERNAVSLTTDIYDIVQWQGGDIVVFDNHIGIVSDRRNRNGVTYVLHHTGPMQEKYEEDILETRDDITGHFRMAY